MPFGPNNSANLKGRPKGSPNKMTREVREVIAEAFQKAGGMKAFVGWAKKHPTEFYKIYAKLLPLSVAVGGDPNLPPIRGVLIEWDDAPADQNHELNGHAPG